MSTNDISKLLANLVALKTHYEMRRIKNERNKNYYRKMLRNLPLKVLILMRYPLKYLKK